MRRVSLDSLDDRLGAAEVARPLTDALSLQNAAINYFELETGDSFAYGYHAHERQEEIFYVESGTATFRTENGDVRVGPRECISFAPGEYQRGVNEDAERVRALAIGAPKEAGDTEIRRSCPECGAETVQELSLTDDRSAAIATCERCGSVTGRFE